MEEREALAWLGRKIGWGLTEGQLDAWTEAGVSSVIDQLVEPDRFEIPRRPDPWLDAEAENLRATDQTFEGAWSWVSRAVESPRPLETFMEFFWHGYFAVSARFVSPQPMIFDHMRLLARHAVGNFADLLSDITVDPSMLQFLDNGLNKKESPNENYARELLELYSVGVENFTEGDVKAASVALTGWSVDNRAAIFDPEQHDDTPQVMLGRSGVHDVASTIDAVLGSAWTSIRVVDKIGQAILGPGYDRSLTEPIVTEFAQTWELKPVVRSFLELGTQGHAVESLLEPLPWYVTTRRLLTFDPHPSRFKAFFRQSRQELLFPPNVGGFPGTDAYLSTSATIARFNLASHFARRSAWPEAGLDAVAIARDLDQLAERLGLLNGFRPATRQAIEALTNGTDRVATALASPDVVVI